LSKLIYTNSFKSYDISLIGHYWTNLVYSISAIIFLFHNKHRRLLPNSKFVCEALLNILLKHIISLLKPEIWWVTCTGKQFKGSTCCAILGTFHRFLHKRINCYLYLNWKRLSKIDKHNNNHISNVTERTAIEELRRQVWSNQQRLWLLISMICKASCCIIRRRKLNKIFVISLSRNYEGRILPVLH